MRDQSDAALVRKVRIRPLKEDTEAVSETDEVHDVNEQPEPPRDPAGDTEAAEVGDGLVAADRGEVPLVAIPKRNGLLVANPPRDVVGSALSLLIRRRRYPRNLHTATVLQRRHVAD